MKLHSWAITLLLFGNALGHAQTTQQADFIVALVKSEPITNAELSRQIRQVSEQRVQQGIAMPAPAELRSAVLERMISDRAQLQLAREKLLLLFVASHHHQQRL